MKKNYNVGIIQLDIKKDKEENIKQAICKIEEAAKNNCDFVLLPEMFTCPYVAKKFHEYAEKEDSSTTLAQMSKVAKRNKIYIVSGTIPELDDGKIYNTCYVFNKEGEIVGKHRKTHLFDINIDNIKFKESDFLEYGNDITIIDTEFGKVGVVVCYDIRFPEYFKILAKAGVDIIFIPAAFNTVTGPAHWELLTRTRAVDNQVYIAASSPARNPSSGFLAYGHSIITSPWGEIIKEARVNEEIIIGKIDLEYLEKVRNKLQLLKHTRNDIYKVERIRNN
jgi:omega-amidase